MLGLKLPTNPRWANLAEMQLADILTDHAYCEQKAASTCISLIQQYPDKDEVVDELAPIVTEEWGHFRMVLKEMKERGFPLGRQRKDEYVNGLMKAVPSGGSRDDKLVERLLVAALIEARSCERFRLLSEGLGDEYLRKFYRHFMVSEAGHYRTFISLARCYKPMAYVNLRWQWWLNLEKNIIQRFELRGDRIH